MVADFEDHQEDVALLCQCTGIKAPEAHMNVDEKGDLPGCSQRRPGAHVDGCYVAEAPSRYWRHPQLAGDWLNYHNQVPRSRMAIIVASSAPGCIVYPGLFQVNPEPDENCKHIRAELGPGLLLEAGWRYLLGPDCIHDTSDAHCTRGCRQLGSALRPGYLGTTRSREDWRVPFCRETQGYGIHW